MGEVKITRTREGYRRYERSDGRVRYRHRVEVGPPGQRRQRQVSAPTIRELRAKIAELVDRRAKGRPAPSKITVREVVEEYLSTREVKPATLRQYRDSAALWLDRLGDLPLAQLRDSHLINVKRELLTSGRRRGGVPGTGLSQRAVTAGLAILRAAFKREVAAGRAFANPAAGLAVERSDGRDRMQVWTVGEARQFAAVAATDRLAVAWHLIMLGLRRSEVAGLRWHDVWLEGEIPTVSVAWARTLHNSRPVEAAPKTQRSRRTLPLPASVADALRRWRADQGPVVPCGLCGGEHVVTGMDGRPLAPPALSHAFGRLCERAGVPQIRLHDARHSTATLMLASGVPLTVVSRWLGHTQPSFTLNTYARHVREDQAFGPAAEALGGLLTA